MADPDFQIMGGGGGGHPDPEIKGGPGLKKIFSSLWGSFWSKNKGDGPPELPEFWVFLGIPFYSKTCK